MNKSQKWQRHSHRIRDRTAKGKSTRSTVPEHCCSSQWATVAALAECCTIRIGRVAIPRAIKNAGVERREHATMVDGSLGPQASDAVQSLSHYRASDGVTMPAQALAWKGCG